MEVFGNSPNTTRLGTLNRASDWRQNWMISASLTSETPGFSSRNAQGVSPQVESGLATTAASSGGTAGGFPADRCDANRKAGKILFLTSFDYAAAASITDVVAAKEKGYFDAVCLDVTLQAGFSTDNVALVASNKAQMTSLGSFSEVAVANNSDANLVAVASDPADETVGEGRLPGPVGTGHADRVRPPGVRVEEREGLRGGRAARLDEGQEARDAAAVPGTRRVDQRRRESPSRALCKTIVRSPSRTRADREAPLTEGAKSSMTFTM